MIEDIDVLEKYKDGREVNLDDNYILEKYRQIGLVKFGMRLKENNQGKGSENVNVTPTASLTPLGKKYLYENKAKNSIIGKLFKLLPL